MWPADNSVQPITSHSVCLVLFLPDIKDNQHKSSSQSNIYQERKVEQKGRIEYIENKVSACLSGHLWALSISFRAVISWQTDEITEQREAVQREEVLRVHWGQSRHVKESMYRGRMCQTSRNVRIRWKWSKNAEEVIFTASLSFIVWPTNSDSNNVNSSKQMHIGVWGHLKL